MDSRYSEIVRNYRDYPRKAWIAFFDAIEAGQSIEQARITADISDGALHRTLEDEEPTFDACFWEALGANGSQYMKGDEPMDDKWLAIYFAEEAPANE
jgi:hypothetical protein